MGVYSNLAAKYAATNNITNESSINLMEMNIKCQNVQLSLFESMIELDILSAKNESGMISLDESVLLEAEEQAKKSLWEKFKTLLHRFKEWIGKIITNIGDKFSDLIHKDSALVKRYDAALKIKDIDWSKSEIKVLDFEKFFADKYDDLYTDRASGKDYFTNFRDSIDSIITSLSTMVNAAKNSDASAEDLIKTNEDTFNQDCKKKYKGMTTDEYVKSKEEKYAAIKDFSKKKDDYMVEASKDLAAQYSDAFNSLLFASSGKGLSKLISNLNKEKDLVDKSITTLIKELDKNKPDYSDEKVNKVYNAAYSLYMSDISKTQALSNKTLTITISIYKELYAELRKYYTIMGTYALKNTKGEDNKEEAKTDANTTAEATPEEKETQESYNYMIGEASDLFVESALEF